MPATPPRVWVRRRPLAAVLVALAVLLALPAAPARAAVVVKQVLGRNAPVYTSYPFDPTPTAKWTASAQGESVDTNGNGIADSLRGRGAVLEQFGIVRVRIHRVLTQALIGGAWTTVQANETDRVSDAQPAYAVQHTLPNRYCATDPTLTRSYRVLNPHAVRRVDGIVAERTTVSHTFTARALATDPACPEAPPPPPPAAADLEVDVQGPPTLQHGTTADLDVVVTNLGPDSAGTVTALVDFSAGLTVVAADARCVLNAATADPNDYACNLGVFGTGETANLDFDVRGDVVGAQAVAASISGTSPAADTDIDTLAVAVVASADLSLDKAIIAPPDAQPTVAGYQVPVGAPVQYRFTVVNAGPDAATNVVVADAWPGPLGTATLLPGGDATGGLTGDDELVLQFGAVAAGTSETVVVQTTVVAGTAPDTTIANTAVVASDQADVDASDRSDTVTIVTIAA